MKWENVKELKSKRDFAVVPKDVKDARNSAIVPQGAIKIRGKGNPGVSSTDGRGEARCSTGRG